MDHHHFDRNGDHHHIVDNDDTGEEKVCRIDHLQACSETSEHKTFLKTGIPTNIGSYGHHHSLPSKLEQTLNPDVTLPCPPEETSNAAGAHVSAVTSAIPSVLRDSVLKAVSGLYGMLLVVTGAIFPIVETFASPESTIFEGFYIFLYCGSCLFLVYVYAYLLRRNRTHCATYIRCFSPLLACAANSGDKDSSKSGDTRLSAESDQDGDDGSSVRRNSSARSMSSNTSGSSKYRRPRVAYNERPNHHTGSFYLRVGCCAFGIGSMIHSGLNFGHYFEIDHLGEACSNVIHALKSLFHLFFTFIQMYFIFMNSKMCVRRHETLAHLGLMHMAGTNVCVWLRAVVVETLHEMQLANRLRLNASQLLNLTASSGQTYVVHQVLLDPLAAKAAKGLLPELQCQWNAMMGNIMEKSSSFLYPCVVEYSLICASVLYVMWGQVGQSQGPRRPCRSEDSATGPDTGAESGEDEVLLEAVLHQQRMSVDCSGSQRGLFIGLLLFVIAVVILVIFYILAGDASSMTSASLMSHISESIIYVTALVATWCAGWNMKHMRFSVHKKVGVEQTLAVVSLTGIIAFTVFNVMAAAFTPFSASTVVTVISNLLMALQACVQAVFMLAAMRVSTTCASDARHKPGRQWVTFLLVVNFALWTINTFETRSMAHNMLQVEFYGPTAWNIFCHISVPLGIYYRFHSTVCLSNIWKNAWKIRHRRERTS